MNRLHAILLRSGTELMGLLMGTLALTWGLYVLAPWSDQLQPPNYLTGLLHLAPHWVWGGWGCLLGLGIYTTVLTDRCRAVTAGAGTAWWLFLMAQLIATTGGRAPGTVQMLVYAAASAWIYLRVRLERP